MIKGLVDKLINQADHHLTQSERVSVPDELRAAHVRAATTLRGWVMVGTIAQTVVDMVKEAR